MKSVEINLNDAEHIYETRMDGVIIVFECPRCPGHSRRLNWETGEATVQGESRFRHAGFHCPEPREMN